MTQVDDFDQPNQENSVNATTTKILPGADGHCPGDAGGCMGDCKVCSSREQLRDSIMVVCFGMDGDLIRPTVYAVKPQSHHEPTIEIRIRGDIIRKTAIDLLQLVTDNFEDWYADYWCAETESRRAFSASAHKLIDSLSSTERDLIAKTIELITRRRANTAATADIPDDLPF